MGSVCVCVSCVADGDRDVDQCVCVGRIGDRPTRRAFPVHDDVVRVVRVCDGATVSLGVVSETDWDVDVCLRDACGVTDGDSV